MEIERFNKQDEERGREKINRKSKRGRERRKEEEKMERRGKRQKQLYGASYFNPLSNLKNLISIL